MPFDPDAYLAKKSTGGFDPDAYLAKKQGGPDTLVADAPRTQLSPNEEQGFQTWYKGWAEKAGIDPDPDNPQHKYDYRGAYKAQVEPSMSPEDGMYHWPSRFKAADHPNRFVGGVDTRAIDQPKPKAEERPLSDRMFVMPEQVVEAAVSIPTAPRTPEAIEARRRVYDRMIAEQGRDLAQEPMPRDITMEAARIAGPGLGEFGAAVENVYGTTMRGIKAGVEQFAEGAKAPTTGRGAAKMVLGAGSAVMGALPPVAAVTGLAELARPTTTAIGERVAGKEGGKIASTLTDFAAAIPFGPKILLAMSASHTGTLGVQKLLDTADWARNISEEDKQLLVQAAGHVGFFGSLFGASAVQRRIATKIAEGKPLTLPERNIVRQQAPELIAEGNVREGTATGGAIPRAPIPTTKPPEAAVTPPATTPKMETKPVPTVPPETKPSIPETIRPSGETIAPIPETKAPLSETKVPTFANSQEVAARGKTLTEVEIGELSKRREELLAQGEKARGEKRFEDAKELVRRASLDREAIESARGTLPEVDFGQPKTQGVPDLSTLAKEAGLEYKGATRDIHFFDDPQTGATLSVKGAPTLADLERKIQVKRSDFKKMGGRKSRFADADPDKYPVLSSIGRGFISPDWVKDTRTGKIRVTGEFESVDPYFLDLTNKPKEIPEGKVKHGSLDVDVADRGFADVQSFLDALDKEQTSYYREKKQLEFAKSLSPEEITELIAENERLASLDSRLAVKPEEAKQYGTERIEAQATHVEGLEAKAEAFEESRGSVEEAAANLRELEQFFDEVGKKPEAPPLELTAPEVPKAKPKAAEQLPLLTAEQKGQAKAPPGAVTSNIPTEKQLEGTMFEQKPVETSGELFGKSKRESGPAAGQMIPIKVSMVRAAGKPVRASEIIAQVSKDLDLPIRAGHAHFGNRAGFFRVKEEVVRNREANDLATTSHEIAHHIDKTILGAHSAQGAQRFNPWKKELADLDYDQKKRRTNEGFAEFVRHYITDDDAQQVAPKFYDHFTNVILKNNPQIAKTVETMKASVTEWRQQGAVQRVLSQIDFGDRPKGPLGERIAQAGKKFATAWSNDLAPINRAVNEMLQGVSARPEPREDPSQLGLYVAKTAPGKARAFVMEGIRDFALNKVSKSLKEVVAPVSKEIKEALAYAYAKRAVELHNRDINPGVTRADADYVLSQGKPEYETFAKEFTEWSGYLLDYLVDAGVLLKDAKAAIRESNLAYIPLKRVFVDMVGAGGPKGRGFTDLPTPVKRIKGSGREIVDPLEAMIAQTEQIIGVADKARVARALVNMAERYEGTGKWVEKVDAPAVIDKIGLEEIKKQLEGIGADLTNTDMDAVLTVFSQGQRYFGKDNVVSIVRDGKREFFELHPDLFRAMKGLDKVTLPWFVNYTFGSAARGVRLGATGLRAGFTLITNPIRDMQTFFLQSEYVGKFPIKTPAVVMRGIWRDLGHSEIAQRFRAGGGEMSQPLGLDRNIVRALVDDVLASDKKRAALNVVKHPIEVAKKAMSFTEAGPRLAEYEAVMKKYEPQIQGALSRGDNVRAGELRENAAVEAGNAAADVTVNFRRMGTYSAFVNQVVPFFNPAIQGLTKMGRTIADHPTRATLRAMAGMTAPTLALWYIHKDEEWYQALEDWERYAFWHFKIGDKIVRLPKPFEWGYLFGGIPEGIANSLYTKDPASFEKALQETVKNLGPIDPTNPLSAVTSVALIGPALEAGFNYDTFRERPVVSRSAEGLLPEYQHGEHTSEIGKWLGKQLGFSPAKVDHMLSGYSGGLLNDVLNVSKREVKESADIPVVGRLFVRSSSLGPGSKWVNEFYNKVADLEKVSATVNSLAKQGKDEEAKKAQTEHEKDYRYYVNNQPRIGRLREAFRGAGIWRRAIIESTDPDVKEKLARHDSEVARAAKAFYEGYRANKPFVISSYMYGLSEFSKAGKVIGKKKSELRKLSAMGGEGKE
jgi:hypothetical protein